MVWIASLVGIGGMVGLGNWRNAILYLLLVGFFQDPIRKLIDGTPVYMQTLVLAFLGIVFLCVLLQNTQLKLSSLYGRDRRLETAWKVFIVLVVLQSAHTYVVHGNSILAGLGLINYITPLAAVMFGVAFVDKEIWLRRFIKYYLCLAVPIALTVYLSFYFQEEWIVLKSIGRLTGTPLLIYDQGAVLYSNSGLMRAGEIAAWHAGTAVMLLVVLATMDRRLGTRIMVGVAVLALVGAIVLTGRRKMVMAIAVFLAIFLLVLMVYWRGMNRMGAFVIVSSVAVALYVWFQPEEGQSTLYAARSATVFQDAMHRLSQAWDLMEAGYTRGGVFGLGAGVSAQGAQHFGGGVRIAGGAGEAGAGKLIVELGLLGLAVVAHLLWRLLLHFHDFFRRVPREQEYLCAALAGITAIIAANTATFLVATQVFGDTFILILMGFFVSFLFALEKLTRGY